MQNDKPLARRYHNREYWQQNFRDLIKMMQKFRKIVDAHRNRVYTFACYWLGDRDEAEDVTQEVLLRLWRNWRSIAAERLPAWLTTVTRNACRDALRKRRTYRALVSSDDDSAINDAIDCSEDPAAAVEVNDFRRHVQNALLHLAEPYRTIVILREIQDMKYEQISEALELPLNTVKVDLHRGRRMLREQLREVIGNEAN